MIPGLGSAIAVEDNTMVFEYLTTLTGTGNPVTGSVDIGVTNGSKEIFLVCTNNKNGSQRTLVAATTTVAGLAVTKASSEHTGPDSVASCAFVATPTQSGSVTITATFSGSIDDGAVNVYRVVNRSNYGNNQNDSSNGSNASAASVSTSSTTINANGFWLGGLVKLGTAAVTSPSGNGAVEDFEATVNSFRHTGNSRTFQSSSITPTDTWSWTGATSCLAASWSFD